MNDRIERRLEESNRLFGEMMEALMNCKELVQKQIKEGTLSDHKEMSSRKEKLFSEEK